MTIIIIIDMDVLNHMAAISMTLQKTFLSLQSFRVKIGDKSKLFEICWGIGFPL